MTENPYDKKPQWRVNEEAEMGVALWAYIIIWPISLWLLAKLDLNMTFKGYLLFGAFLAFFPAIIGIWIGKKLTQSADRNRKSKDE